MSEYRKATGAAENHAHKLEAVCRVHGREGLKEFSGEDVCFLYWCLQHEVRGSTPRSKAAGRWNSTCLSRSSSWPN